MGVGSKLKQITLSNSFLSRVAEDFTQSMLNGSLLLYSRRTLSDEIMIKYDKLTTIPNQLNTII